MASAVKQHLVGARRTPGLASCCKPGCESQWGLPGGPGWGAGWGRSTAPPAQGLQATGYWEQAGGDGAEQAHTPKSRFPSGSEKAGKGSGSGGRRPRKLEGPGVKVSPLPF